MVKLNYFYIGIISNKQLLDGNQNLSWNGNVARHAGTTIGLPSLANESM